MIERLRDWLVGGGALWVIWVLAALSAGSLAVTLERARLFFRKRAKVGELTRELHTLLGAGDVESAQRRLANSKSTAAIVALAGLAQWERGATAVKEAMAAAAGLERARLERHLMLLGTVGSNAPFIGLLGTVIGVIGAFDELGSVAAGISASQAAPEKVMSAIAEALVATAVGLIVAIPAVVFYNYFHGLSASLTAGAETLGHVLLTHAAPTPAPVSAESPVEEA